MLIQSHGDNIGKVTSSNITYPVDVFPLRTQRFIQETATSIGVEDSFPASILLSVVSGTIGNSARMKLKDDYAEIAPIWVSLVAPSGRAKTPVFSAIMEPVESIQAEADSRYSLQVKQYKIAKKRYAVEYQAWRGGFMDDPCAKMPEEPEKPSREQFLFNDASLCSIIEGLEQYQSGSLQYQDELSGLLKSLDSSKLALFLSLFSGKSIRYSRNGKDDLIVPNPSLALCGTIQPKVLKRIITRNVQLDDSGFLYRFLFCMPSTKAVSWSDKTISPETKAAFADTIKRIFDMRGSATGTNVPVNFSLSLAAYDIWVAFRNVNTDKENNTVNDMIRAGLAKLPTHAARIVLTLHVLGCSESGLPYSEWPSEVDAQTMAGAVRLIEWYENELRNVIEMIQGRDAAIVDDDMDRILNAIERAEAGLTLRGLQRATGRRFNATGGADELEQLLRKMVKMGRLSTQNKMAANGRAVEHFALPDFVDTVDVDTMEENTGNNTDSVNIVPPEKMASPVDTMPENTGKNSVNVDLSTQERPISIENPSLADEATRPNDPSNAASEEQQANSVTMAVKSTYEKGGHGGITRDVFSLS